MIGKRMDNLEKDLLEAIMELCQLDGPPPDEMNADSPLIGPNSPLELDSLDAVEIIVMIQERYGVRITSRETSIEVLNSLKTIADYIRVNTQNATPKVAVP